MKGICFKEHLLHQSIAGKKTQTRRTVTILNRMAAKATSAWMLDEDGTPYVTLESGEIYQPKPQYKPGQYYYIKEPIHHAFHSKRIEYKYDYAFDDEFRLGTRWENKLFMSEKFARHFILIEKVELGYLYQISRADVIAEGVDYGVGTFFDDRKGNVQLEYFSSYAFNKRTRRTQPEAYATFGPAKAKHTGPMAHLHAFESLINRINGQGFWETNPLVWKYTYKHLTNRPLS